MSKKVTKISKTRVRAFLCLNCDIHNEFLGECHEPLVCLECGGPLKPSAEYDIVTTTRRISEPNN